MKKALAVLVLALFVGTAAFAVPAFGLSAGAGGIFTKAFGGGIEGGGNTYDMPSLGAGAFAFLDATFVELDIGFTYNWGRVGVSDENFGFSVLGFGLLGKYPFEVGPVVIFPMIGIEYRHVVVALWKGEDLEGSTSDWSRFSFQFGAGVDYHFTPALFLRGEVLYAVRSENKFEKDMADSMTSFSAISLRSHGPDFKIAIGYQFF